VKQRTPQKEIHELKMTPQILKEDLNKDLEILRRNNQTEIPLVFFDLFLQRFVVLLVEEIHSHC
jgi:hypothetical protein